MYSRETSKNTTLRISNFSMSSLIGSLRLSSEPSENDEHTFYETVINELSQKPILRKNMNIKQAIGRVITRQNLTEAEMISVMNDIMGGSATDAQIGSFITALRMKGETIDEIVGAVRVMREKATFVDSGVDTAGGEVLMDIVGTGGDGSGTFNVSTTTAFVVAAAGVPVAKHGNRAVSSNCGSADVLEALGVDLSLSAETVSSCVRSVGIGFLFAPMLHGAMKYAIGPRRGNRYPLYF